MSHDAATGYFHSSTHRGADNAATHLYAKNQIGSVYQQLDDGARALDIRPKFVTVAGSERSGVGGDGSTSQSSSTFEFDVVCHHGAVSITVPLQKIIADAVRWCNDNPDELVLILHHNLAWPSSSSSISSPSSSSVGTPDADVAVNVMSDLYKSLGVPYVQCADLYGLTVGQTMEIASLSSSSGSNSGYLIAMDQHDAYLSSCAKLNYVDELLVTCYSDGRPCTKIPPPPPTRQWNRSSSSTTTTTTTTNTAMYPSALAALYDYVLQSCNNAPTNDSKTLGPPANDYTYLPFNEIQAMWQVDGMSATKGVAHLSSLLDDNTKSHVNAYVVQWVYEGLMTAPISLVAIDQVHKNGIALLSVLRTQCGQFSKNEHATNDDDSSDRHGSGELPCGNKLPPPRVVIHRQMSTMTFAATIISCLLFGGWMWLAYKYYRRHFDHDHHMKQLQEDFNETYVSMAESTGVHCGHTTSTDTLDDGKSDTDGFVRRKQSLRVEGGVVT
jgi:hypothetical protein